ncbi:Sapep family Mn(2+)-dependent dipeptidase [Clostridium sp. KNHs214]|uniref:Sapep family Mn(2+)-dependent dipeptidase n=1 Tax=Clostridium sp. KNHs214 TaxID=1540257 RepID=UPI0005567A92|nr:Sapep family Mn(2+)-dependent dipeptidase [Clostridium sp. KNHs214]
MEKILNNKIDELKDSLIEHIIEVVKIPSIKGEAKPQAPFGENVNNALMKALEISKELGFKTKNIDGYMGYAQLGEGEDYIGVLGHLDVVPIEEGWNNPPFSGHVEDGKIYSRGVLDNKGPIISALYALYVIKECNLKLNKPVRIIFGTDEESGFKDLNYYLTKEKPPIMGFTPDCKYPVVYGERGRAKIKIGTKVYKENYEELTQEFFNMVNDYFLSSKSDGDRLGINYNDKEFGSMEMRKYYLDMKEGCLNFQFDLSYPAVCTIEEIIEQIESKISTNFQIELLQNYNPVRFEKDCFLVKSLQEAYEEVTCLDGTPVTTTGGTYAKLMPNIVPFGPSFPGQKGIAHNPNEYMDINDIILNAKIYTQAIYKLAK